MSLQYARGTVFWEVNVPGYLVPSFQRVCKPQIGSDTEISLKLPCYKAMGVSWKSSHDAMEYLELYEVNRNGYLTWCGDSCMKQKPGLTHKQEGWVTFVQ